MNARELTNRLAALLRKEHSAMADFLLALADFDGQRLWLEMGHASLFSFLRRELGLSAGAAQYRKTAAELVQRFPGVEAALRDGKLCLSSIIALAKVITPENQHETLPRFFGLSRREAEMVAVSIRPVENVPRRDLVTTRSPTPTTSTSAAAPSPASPSTTRPEEPLRPAEPVTTLQSVDPLVRPAETIASTAPQRSLREIHDSAEPLDSARSRFHVTVSRKFLEKLGAAKAALSHAHPSASAGKILEAGLDLVLAQHEKRKGLVAKPRKAAHPTRSGVVPAAVKREVWQRAGGRCEVPVESGGVCGSTLRLEFDHVVPKACGGPATADNVRVACRIHNQLAARRWFGDWMDQFTRARAGNESAHPAAPQATAAE